LEKLPNSAIFQKVLLFRTLSQNEIGENDLQGKTEANATLEFSLRFAAVQGTSVRD
jgi:hypothetical protein